MTEESLGLEFYPHESYILSEEATVIFDMQER